MQPLHRLDVRVEVPILRAGGHPEAPPVDVVGHGHARADGRRVDRHRLLREDVLGGVDRRADVRGAEARRGGEDDVVDVGLQQLPVGVEPDETVVVGHSRRVAVRVHECLPGGVEPILERVGHGHHAHAGRRRDGVARGAGAAASAAHEPDPDFVAARRVGAHEPIQAARHRADHRRPGGVADEVTPRHARGRRLLLTAHAHSSLAPPGASRGTREA